MPTPEVAKMGWLERTLAGVNPDGSIKAIEIKEPGRLNRLGGALLLGGPTATIGLGLGGPVGAVIGAGIGGKYGWSQGFNALAGLSPAARATEQLNSGALNVASLLDMADDSPETSTRYIKSLGTMPVELAAEIGMRTINSPSAAAVTMALRDFGPKADAYTEPQTGCG
jgi:hypothetical protein